MITRDELLELLADIESDRVECTQSVNDTDKFSKAVAAFANDFPNHKLPGYLVIGVEDKTRQPVGLQVTDELLRNLAGLRSDGNIQPLPAINVAKFNLAGGDVAVVEVFPSNLPPVRYKGQVWIRVGPRSASSSEQDERILTERRVSNASTFDARPCLDSAIEDLSVNLFKQNYLPAAVSEQVVAENHREVKQQLASLRFLDLRTNCPTNAGILLFGKNPLAFLPGAYVQFLRIEGTQLSDPVLAAQELSGDLFTLLREIELLTHIQIERRPVKESLLRERIFETYPERAIRELLVNAVLHRSYESNTPVRFYWFSDRVEIINPGGLYGEATPENFPDQTSYRNPVLAEAMKTLGFVEKFGRGVILARAALDQNGNPPPEFAFDSRFVRVTIRAKT